VTRQVSHPYDSTDFTQALNILILISFRYDHSNFIQNVQFHRSLLLNFRIAACYMEGSGFEPPEPGGPSLSLSVPSGECRRVSRIGSEHISL